MLISLNSYPYMDGRLCVLDETFMVNKTKCKCKNNEGEMKFGQRNKNDGSFKNHLLLELDMSNNSHSLMTLMTFEKKYSNAKTKIPVEHSELAAKISVYLYQLLYFVVNYLAKYKSQRVRSKGKVTENVMANKSCHGATVVGVNHEPLITNIGKPAPHHHMG